MKNSFLFLFYVIFSFRANAQANIESLVKTEKQFAAYSVAHGTKDAFLAFLDSNGIVFDNGQPVNGIALWQKRDNGPGILNWTPQFAEISLGNDFGYTSGPWTFQASAGDSVVASGQYTTVWHINPQGQWKFLVDLGVSRVPVHQGNELKVVNHKKSRKNRKNYLEAEHKFIQSFSSDRQRTYKNFLSSESILLRNGILPAGNDEEKLKIISHTPPAQLHMLGSGISTSGDLAYVFGSVHLEGKTDNYLHIWRREKQHWKLAFEVLRY